MNQTCIRNWLEITILGISALFK